jgi:hypothetical protein
MVETPSRLRPFAPLLRENVPAAREDGLGVSAPPAGASLGEALAQTNAPVPFRDDVAEHFLKDTTALKGTALEALFNAESTRSQGPAGPCYARQG